MKKTAVKKTAVKKTVAPKAVKKTVTKPVVKTTAPHRYPQHRPPAFVVAGARREPLDEMPLTDRAALLLRWVGTHPKPTNANVRHWLYQQSWIVTGAEMGWWHGAAALRTLITADSRVTNLWGIGSLSRAQAEQALKEVSSRS